MPAPPPPDDAAPAPLLDADDVLPSLTAWRRDGARAALVTIVGIEGTSPRPIGAQMAVAEDGRAVGYLSGGCLEQAVALEAQAAIKEGRNRLVRYGRGSPYFDVRLPCGSGIDLYFDQALGVDLLEKLADLRAVRRPALLRTDLKSGASAVEAISAPALPLASRRDGDMLLRVVLPRLRLILIGSGPSVEAIARLATVLGVELDVLSPDAATLAAVRRAGCRAAELVEPTLHPLPAPDPSTAVVLAFHEHDWEPPIIAEALRSPAFYVGALGNRAVHQARLAALAKSGFGASDIARVRGPIGLIAGAKSQATLALGVIAEVAAKAKALGLVP